MGDKLTWYLVPLKKGEMSTQVLQLIVDDVDVTILFFTLLLINIVESLESTVVMRLFQNDIEIDNDDLIQKTINSPNVYFGNYLVSIYLIPIGPHSVTDLLMKHNLILYFIQICQEKERWVSPKENYFVSGPTLVTGDFYISFCVSQNKLAYIFRSFHSDKYWSEPKVIRGSEITTLIEMFLNGNSKPDLNLFNLCSYYLYSENMTLDDKILVSNVYRKRMAPIFWIFVEYCEFLMNCD